MRCNTCVKRRPIRFHPALNAKVRPKTLALYQKALLVFLGWCALHSVTLDDVEDIDDWLVEWSLDTSVGISAFSRTIAAVELILPHAIGRLPTAKSVLKGMQLQHKTKHHVPLMPNMLLVFAVMLAALRGGRAASTLVLQGSRGLRPSEALNVRPGDIFLPPDGDLVISLGAKLGTKVNRPQAIVVHPGRDDRAIEAARRLTLTTPEGQNCSQMSYREYAQLSVRVSTLLKLKERVTAHGPRPGWATSELMKGTPQPDIQAMGRWASAESLRTYLDAVSAAAQRVADQNSIWKHLIADAALRFWTLVPAW